MHHLLSVNDLSKEDIDFILNRVPSCGKPIHVDCFKTIIPNNDKIMATLFFEPSTRTKMSFQAAMYKIGGKVIDLPSESSQSKGETDADTIRTISEYADVLVIRHPKGGIMEELSRYSKKPIINAGDGSNEHPTQALTDLYTIRKHTKNKDKISIMFTGDLYYSRTISSLLELLKRENKEYKFIFTNKLAPWVEIDDSRMVYAHEGVIIPYLSDIDILYMTRSQKERWNPKSPPPSKFILTKELVNMLEEDAIVMHPLPRNEEIHPDVDKNHRAKYFEQVENGLYVRAALLEHILWK